VGRCHDTVEALTTQAISCDVSAPLAGEVPGAAAGESGLHYDSVGGYSMTNWRVPKIPGSCYMVRVTTVADGLALTAKFAVK